MPDVAASGEEPSIASSSEEPVVVGSDEEPAFASPEACAGLIKTNWQHATECIMAVAHLCNQANKQFGPEQKKELFKQLPFSQPVFSKLAQIGGDERLHQPEVQKLLPPNYSIIYDVGQLKDTELKAAIEDGIITPDLKRSELAEWLETKDPPSSEPDKSATIPEEFFAAIRVPDDISDPQVERLNQILEEICSEFGAEIVRPRNIYAEKMGRWHERVMKHIRKGARRLVRESKRHTKKMGGKWGFEGDEVSIDADVDLDRIRKVLDTLGRGDEFASLLREAYNAVDQPEVPKNAAVHVDLQAQFDELAEQLAKRGRRPPGAFADFS